MAVDPRRDRRWIGPFSLRSFPAVEAFDPEVAVIDRVAEVGRRPLGLADDDGAVIQDDGPAGPSQEIGRRYPGDSCPMTQTSHGRLP